MSVSTVTVLLREFHFPQLLSQYFSFMSADRFLRSCSSHFSVLNLLLKSLRYHMLRDIRNRYNTANVLGSLSPATSTDVGVCGVKFGSDVLPWNALKNTVIDVPLNCSFTFQPSFFLSLNPIKVSSR